MCFPSYPHALAGGLELQEDWAEEYGGPRKHPHHFDTVFLGLRSNTCIPSKGLYRVVEPFLTLALAMETGSQTGFRCQILWKDVKPNKAQ